MRASRRALVVALVFLASFAAAQLPDQVIAERVLGPRWKQLSRRAGMIFAGTVLANTAQIPTAQIPAADRAVPGSAPAVELRFRVDQAIAGVERGQVLTIHEWAGASSMHRPMSPGQHILIFLYPPSRLGLTSPVGGSLGQIFLDASGKNVSKSISKSISKNEREVVTATGSRNSSSLSPSLSPVVPAAEPSVSVVQLVRAIRAARSEEK